MRLLIITLTTIFTLGIFSGYANAGSLALYDLIVKEKGKEALKQVHCAVGSIAHTDDVLYIVTGKNGSASFISDAGSKIYCVTKDKAYTGDVPAASAKEVELEAVEVKGCLPFNILPYPGSKAACLVSGCAWKSSCN